MKIRSISVMAIAVSVLMGFTLPAFSAQGRLPVSGHADTDYNPKTGSAVGNGKLTIGEKTYEKVKGQFHIIKIGKKSVKGKSKAVTVYEVVG